MKSSMKLTKKEIFSIPNILCYFRILLIPVFMISYINAKETRGYYFAAFIVLLSGLTDFADGFIARHFNMVTELGKAIDPVADKLSQAAIVISLMIRSSFLTVLAAALLLCVGYHLFCNTGE